MRLPLLFLLIVGLAAPLHPKPLPLEKLYDPFALTGVKISPSGDRLTMVISKDGEQHITVINLADLKPTPIARLGFSRLSNIWWTSENRVLLLVSDPNGNSDFKSVDIETGKSTTHFVGQYSSKWLVHELPEKPDKVLIASTTANYNGYELRELDLITNRTRLLEKNPGQVRNWLLNARGDVVAAVEMTSESYSLLQRPSNNARWSRKPYGTPEEPIFEFLAVHPDQRRLLALDYRSDPSRLVAVDPGTLESEPMFAPEKFDPFSLETEGRLGGVPQSILHPSDSDRRHHLSGDSAALMQVVDRALTNTFNSIHSISRDGRRLVIFSYSEQNPGSYHLLDRNSGRLMFLGSSMEGIEPETLGRARSFNFTTSDGLTIHGKFLSPANPTKPTPLILLLEDEVFGHRESTTFSTWRQAFATRGYAVAKIDYRGTRGYGHGFAKKGRQQITERIPLDLAEGVQWLGRQGWIDPQRVLIMGSYESGWVAMNALVRTSTTYAGWINLGTWIGHEIEIGTTKPGYAMANWDNWQNRLDLKASGIEKAPPPVKLLSEITVPAFHHYYEFATGQLSSGGVHVERDLRTNKRDAVLVTRRSADTIQAVRANQLAVYEKLFTFLAERFPTEQNPRPATATGRN